ncbi:hypothetical protein BD311DRAFT_721123 [Dichomitus squalens]|uniref:Uncharacterized protein n=2 Tax=Dichomitus squalens TaxID=114155 RepID=A0A4Q9MQB8_9APHY|nr:hypothetical protein BD311DRAFT_721123 [Dichomitus squalens]
MRFFWGLPNSRRVSSRFIWNPEEDVAMGSRAFEAPKDGGGPSVLQGLPAENQKAFPREVLGEQTGEAGPQARSSGSGSGTVGDILTARRRDYTTFTHNFFFSCALFLSIYFLEGLSSLFGERTVLRDMSPDEPCENPPSEQLPGPSDLAQTRAENARLKAMLRNHGLLIQAMPPTGRIAHPLLALGAAPGQRSHPGALTSSDVPSWSTSSGPPVDRTAYFPEHGANGQILVLPRREQDYPHAAKFWTKRKYETWTKSADFTVPGAIKGRQGPGRLKQSNENVKMQFVIDVHGNPIDGDRAVAIRAAMRDWLRGRTDLPDSWKGGATLQMKTALYAHMYARYPELQLNDFDWKVEQIAIDVFSQFAAIVRRKSKLVKKRASKKSRKRARVESDGDAPWDSPRPVDLNDAIYHISAPCDTTSIGPSRVIAAEANIPSVRFWCPFEHSVRTHYAFIQSLPSHGIAEPELPNNVTASERPIVQPTPRRPCTHSEHLSGGSTPIPMSRTELGDSATPSVLDVLADACATIHNSRSAPNNQPHSPTSPTHSRSVSYAPEQNSATVPSGADSGDGNSGLPVNSQLHIPNPLAGMWPTSGTAPLSLPNSRSPSPDPDVALGRGRQITSTKPSKSDINPRVWPPTPSKTKPKDQCARIWKSRHPEGTESEFDKYYKEAIPTQNLRNKYVRNNGDLTASSSRKRGGPSAASQDD